MSIHIFAINKAIHFLVKTSNKKGYNVPCKITPVPNHLKYDTKLNRQNHTHKRNGLSLLPLPHTKHNLSNHPLQEFPSFISSKELEVYVEITTNQKLVPL